MAKFIVIGDLHVSKEPIRLAECLNFLDYIQNYGKKNQIDKLIFLGDLFHTCNNVSYDSFIPFFNKMFELKNNGFELYVIAGNHDIRNKDGDCLIESFIPFCNFYKKSATIEIDDVKYDFLSYTDNPQDIPNKGQVLFGHLEIENFWFNPVKKVDNSIFNQELFDSYETVVSGHLHKKQNVGKFNFIGTPYSTNRSECGQHYFAILDRTKIEYIEYNEAPEYMTISIEEALEKIQNQETEIFKNKLLTIEISSKVEQFVKLRQMLLNIGAVDVKAEFIKKEEQDFSEHKINSNEGTIISMTKFLNEIKKPNIDNQELLKRFKVVLERCKNS